MPRRKIAVRRLGAVLSFAVAVVPNLAAAKWEFTTEPGPSFGQIVPRASLTGQGFDLEVQCRGGKLEARVLTRAFIGSGQVAAVSYWFDREPVRQELWTLGADERSVSSRAPRSFIDQVIKSSTLVVEIETFSGSARGAALKLEGAVEPLKRVLDACPDAPADAPAPMPAAPSVITRPDWLRRPTPDQLFSRFPARALRLKQEGEAVLTCTASDKGGLTRCSVASETPAGLGFGAAALNAAVFYQIRPRADDGTPVSGATVMVTIPFKLK